SPTNCSCRSSRCSVSSLTGSLLSVTYWSACPSGLSIMACACSRGRSISNTCVSRTRYLRVQRSRTRSSMLLSSRQGAGLRNRYAARPPGCHSYTDSAVTPSSSTGWVLILSASCHSPPSSYPPRSITAWLCAADQCSHSDPTIVPSTSIHSLPSDLLVPLILLSVSVISASNSPRVLPCPSVSLTFMSSAPCAAGRSGQG